MSKQTKNVSAKQKQKYTFRSQHILLFLKSSLKGGILVNEHVSHIQTFWRLSWYNELQYIIFVLVEGSLYIFQVLDYSILMFQLFNASINTKKFLRYSLYFLI